MSAKTQKTVKDGNDPAGLANFRFKTIDDLKIRYATSGPAKGTPILLLSPWPEKQFRHSLRTNPRSISRPL
jgi:hypothetical protein